ncbi:colicin D domain-containing protein [uncultured Pluralibacter sp.]|uniref:colicin D domain-containing protein n=1 Tax=uncultured Pluralibacter sp. TaxID=1490864 RepID=UPI002614281F|nr:colicin D domain-containing protein [uncultured Pluralibacter sp.]
MFHQYQARTLDNIYLEDIAHLVHPEIAATNLEKTSQSNRVFNQWDLPGNYSTFVNKYRQFHHLQPWMAYREALRDLKAGRIVLQKNEIFGSAIMGVLTFTGILRDDLPLLLHSRLSYLISHQVKRPAQNALSMKPTQQVDAAKTINSRAAGRLLAAGGIYNGNIEGFRKTAEQLGGGAPEGYNQVMENKGLLIAGTSIAAGLGIGRLTPASEIKTLSNFFKVPKPPPSALVSFEPRQLQKKFKHAADFNVSGNPNIEGLEAFEKALKNHIDSPLTKKILGKYRWNQDVYHHYNPTTKLNVMTKPDGNFISGWKLTDTQATDLTGNGNVY